LPLTTESLTAYRLIEDRVRGSLQCGNLARLKPAQGQERRIDAVRNISALPPRADVGADIVEPPLRANSGRELSQQSSLPYSITSSVRASNAGGTSRPKYHTRVRSMGFSH
jgi:hypothetical protein